MEGRWRYWWVLWRRRRWDLFRCGVVCFCSFYILNNGKFHCLRFSWSMRFLSICLWFLLRIKFRIWLWLWTGTQQESFLVLFALLGERVALWWMKSEVEVLKPVKISMFFYVCWRFCSRPIVNVFLFLVSVFTWLLWAIKEKATKCKYENLDGHLKERSWSHMLGTQIPSNLEGFGVSNFHIWH